MFGDIPMWPKPPGAFGVTGSPSTGWTMVGGPAVAATPALTVTKTATGSETIAAFGVSDNTVGKFEIANSSSSANDFATLLKGTGAGANVALFIIGAVTTDSGTTTPAIVLDGRTAAGGALSTKDVFGLRNFGTTVLKVAAGGQLTTVGGQVGKVRVALTTPVTVVALTDFNVVCKLTTPGAVAVTLPAGVAGQEFIIQDGTGDAAANNITITPAAGTINGAATLVIAANYGRTTLRYDGTLWLAG